MQSLTNRLIQKYTTIYFVTQCIMEIKQVNKDHGSIGGGKKEWAQSMDLGGEDEDKKKEIRRSLAPVEKGGKNKEELYKKNKKKS